MPMALTMARLRKSSPSTNVTAVNSRSATMPPRPDFDTIAPIATTATMKNQGPKLIREIRAAGSSTPIRGIKQSSPTPSATQAGETPCAKSVIHSIRAAASSAARVTWPRSQGGGGGGLLCRARPVREQDAQDRGQADQGDEAEHREMRKAVFGEFDADAVDALRRADHDQVGDRGGQDAEPGIERAAGGGEHQRRASVAPAPEAEPVGQRRHDGDQDRHAARIRRHQEAHRRRGRDDAGQDREVAGADSGDEHGRDPCAEAGGLHRRGR